MKFTIEIDDFWLDSEDELEPALKRYVINEVTDKIHKSISDKVDKAILVLLNKEFEIGYGKKVEKFISDSFEDGELKIGQDDLSAKEYFLSQAKNNYGWSSVKDALEKSAKRHVEEMKKRYDLYYASHVVSKLSENGLLKDDKLKELLE